MINPKPNRLHQYKLRSCLNCEYFIDKSCHAYDEHQEPFLWADKGRYGCILYRGIYQNEQRKRDKNRRKKKKLEELKEPTKELDSHINTGCENS